MTMMRRRKRRMALILTGTRRARGGWRVLLMGHAAARGNSGFEIAGFTAALRAHVAEDIRKADLDWAVLCRRAIVRWCAVVFLRAARLLVRRGTLCRCTG